MEQYRSLFGVNMGHFENIPTLWGYSRVKTWLKRSKFRFFEYRSKSAVFQTPKFKWNIYEWAYIIQKGFYFLNLEFIWPKKCIFSYFWVIENRQFYRHWDLETQGCQKLVEKKRFEHVIFLDSSHVLSSWPTPSYNTSH